MRPRGYTLIELMVAVIVSSLVMMIALKANIAFQDSTLAMRDRASVVVELRLAASYLLADFGGADTALPDGGGLQIRREQAIAELLGAWDEVSGEDEGIIYSLADGELTRWDVPLDTEVVVARLTRFEVTRRADETTVVLGAGSGLNERSVELIWPE